MDLLKGIIYIVKIPRKLWSVTSGRDLWAVFVLVSLIGASTIMFQMLRQAVSDGSRNRMFVIHTSWNNSEGYVPPGKHVTFSLTGNNNNVAEFKPFAAHLPHLVLIFSYQRCGSSFFGGLFDRPGGLYIYEPLDGLYGAMYGIAEGWSVPSDIMNWKNGSQRDIPDAEAEAVSTHLENILSCRYHSVPNEFLLHRFWGQFLKYQLQLKPFVNCLGAKNLVRVHGDCHKPLGRECSSRFGDNIDKMNACNRILWNKTTNSVNDQVTNNTKLANYTRCMNLGREKTSFCVLNLIDFCQKTHFRSVKTVRATMNSMESLVKKLPNLRIIHLIRDPRAVVLSRSHFHSSGKSLYAKNDIVKEAKIFCQNLLRDIKLRKSLELKYPGVFMEVIFDDFVNNPMEQTENIYRFMNITLTEDVKAWVIKSTQDKKNSTHIASKWQTDLNFFQVRQISDKCRDIFDLVSYNWVL